ncbi:MAG: hypothetical protein ACRC62_19685, partial [Microcoleus sp.]
RCDRGLMSLLKKFASESEESESDKLSKTAKEYGELMDQAAEVLRNLQQLERENRNEEKPPPPSKQ